MASKDDTELGMMKRASAITLEIYSKVFKENLKDVINADRVSDAFLMQFFNEYCLKYLR